MTLLQILVFTAISLLCSCLTRRRGRAWLMLAVSVLAIYWMQPSTPIRHLDFWAPSAALILAVLVWSATRSPGTPLSKQDVWTAIIIAGLVAVIAVGNYLGPLCCLTPTRPPGLPGVVIAAGLTALVAFLLLRGSHPVRLHVLSLLILLLFVVLKTDFLAHDASAALRRLAGQSVELASALDLRWLGYSYVAFRLVHALRDRLAGRLPDISLQEFIIFIIFFPAYTAGPIDRVQRFVQDMRQPSELTGDILFKGAARLFLGIFTKFFLADSLAIIALNAATAGQVTAPGWLWLLLYAYTLRIYFDFAGYTGIAIGLGTLWGVRLPENFDRPYLKPNLTAFWNAWHITLTQWFRAYFFNPFTRYLRSSPRQVPMPLIILLGQVGTMLLVGLWHGVTWNFFIWGAWHGIGLFFHNRWADWRRTHPAAGTQPVLIQRLSAIGGTLLTFHYVALGWVWFALPTPQLSWRVLGSLFGLG